MFDIYDQTPFLLISFSTLFPTLIFLFRSFLFDNPTYATAMATFLQFNWILTPFSSIIVRAYNHAHIHFETHTDTQTNRHTDTHRHTQTHRHTDTQTHRHTDTHRHTQTHTDTHRHTQTHTDTHRHTQTHTENKNSVPNDC